VLDELDGRIGEAWAGEAPNGAHINVVVARRGSPTAAAIVGALASPRPGHLPFLACVRLGEVVRPVTLIVNKNTLAGDVLPRLTWGAAQLGVAQGVLDAVAEGIIDPADAAELVLLVPVWVDEAASDETAVRLANREATRAALASAVRPPTADEVRALASRRDQATNAYYSGR
jgi:5,6,7,8-tetrahydromethanopterin hydro-lyase